MPITRVISVRSKVSTDDALSMLVVTSSVARDIADLLQFPPAKAAASILLLIFQTIQRVQTNKQECHRLARRCLSLLVSIREQVIDHGGTAPPSLVKALAKFEGTLESIYKFISQVAEQKWSTRLIRKNTIDSALSDYNAALDDAARAFQIATLINIHLAVGTGSASDSSTKDLSQKALESSVAAKKGQPSTSATLPPYTLETITDTGELSLSPAPSRTATMSSFGGSENSPAGRASIDLIDLSSPESSEFRSSTSISKASLKTPDEEEGKDAEAQITLTEHHGFSRYHQSQFRMKGKSRSIKDGWWAGAVEGEINGQKSLMLRYEGERRTAMKSFVRDVKMLQNVYHPNLPQMVGYSNDETPTPFILLANVQTRLPQALLLDSLKNATLARCAQLLLQFYRDTLDAALYYQQQLGLSDSKLQDYVEHASYRIDMEQTVIMGLPPPEVDNIVSWRNFGLAHSIRDIYLRILPNSGMAPKQPVDLNDQITPADVQRKVNHLILLTRAILPSTGELSTVRTRLHKLLGSLEDDEECTEVLPMTLRQIRKAAISANAHQHTWFANDRILPYQFSVGDLGYFPIVEGVSGEEDWSRFVVLGNVIEDGSAKLDSSSVAGGKQGAWQNGICRWDDLVPFELPGGIYAWTVVVPPEAEFSINIAHVSEVTRVDDAWNHLLDVGKIIAKKHGMKPEDLILITRVGVEQRFKVRDLRRVQYWHTPHRPGHNLSHSRGFQHGQAMGFNNHFGQQPFGSGNSQRVIPGQDLAPKIFYLLTSGNKEHEPYFSLTPMHTPLPKGEKPPPLDPGVVRCFALLDIAYGFLNYAQLHSEDFAD